MSPVHTVQRGRSVESKPPALGEVERLEVVVSGTVSDAHTWNLVFLQLLLEEGGHRVTNLGACVPDELLAAECALRRPDLIVLSSVNGHGYLDGIRVIRLLRKQVELRDAWVVIGGKLGIAGADENRRRLLIDAGFDAVYEDDVAIQRFSDYVSALPRGVAVA